jgi:NTP pyrophosphohydrolases including oxidative damage repair enzymes
MIHATSSGVIAFRTTREKVEYLVLKGRTGDWEFPKGGIENDEELQQTSLRELEEESGITDVKLYPDFKRDYEYMFYSNGEKIMKTVHLFIGHSFQASVDLSDEHSDHQWRTYEQARGTLTHDVVKEILDDAHDFITKNIV